MVATRAWAGVGKPPREEIASRCARWFSELYGDLAAALGVSDWLQVGREENLVRLMNTLRPVGCFWPASMRDVSDARGFCGAKFANVEQAPSLPVDDQRQSGSVVQVKSGKSRLMRCRSWSIAVLAIGSAAGIHVRRSR